MNLSTEQKEKLARAERILGYAFTDRSLLLAAITHPSATEGQAVKYSYERLEFLGDSILGAIVASEAFHRYPELDEGGLTRIKVALVSGTSLSDIAEGLGFAEIIVFGLSETGTGKRGLHSALENVYEAIVAALYLDGGKEASHAFIQETLFPKMSHDLACEPENPKSALQEKLQEDGITPTYKLVDTQGPPHDRTFVSQVFAGVQALARGVGRTKKEAESQAAKSALDSLGEFFLPESSSKKSKNKARTEAELKAEKEATKLERDAAKEALKAERAEARAKEKAENYKSASGVGKRKRKKQG